MRRALPLLLVVSFACEAKTMDLCPPNLHEVDVPAAVQRPADILFVVDNSRSMEEEQAELSRSFGRFIDGIAGSGAYRVAVVTTDQSFDDQGFGEMAGISNLIHAPQYPNQLIDIDDSRCSPVRPRLEHGCFRGRAAERIVDSERSGRQQQIDAFGRNVRVGTCGAGAEQAFEAMRTAFRELEGCNQGFRRDDANLVIIFVSDEDDRSPGEVDMYVDDLEARFDLTRVRVATVVGTLDGQPAYCVNGRGGQCGNYCEEVEIEGSHQPCSFDGTMPPCPEFESCQPRGPNAVGRCVAEPPESAAACASCSRFNNQTCCTAEPGQRYVAFARELERRAVLLDNRIEASGCAGLGTGRPACITDTICQNDFGDSLARIARDLVSSNVYDLVPPAEVGRPLEVVLDGEQGVRVLEPQTQYFLAEDLSTVTLIGTGVPGPEDTVRIRYNTSIELEGTNCLPRP